MISPDIRNRKKYTGNREEEFLESYGLGKNVSAEKAFKFIEEMGITGSSERGQKNKAVRNDWKMHGITKKIYAGHHINKCIRRYNYDNRGNSCELR
jgi:hypothetical protein